VVGDPRTATFARGSQGRKVAAAPSGGMETSVGPFGACPLCALPRTPEDVVGLTWSSQHELDGTVTYICPTCTRAQLWRIEALLAVATPTAPAAATRLRPAA
jgi:hypothetical protein